jgi:hypothetical protein
MVQRVSGPSSFPDPLADVYKPKFKPRYIWLKQPFLRGLIYSQATTKILRNDYYILLRIKKIMTDIAKKIKNTFQDSEAKTKTEQDHAEGKPSSETLNKAKVKTRDALT